MGSGRRLEPVWLVTAGLILFALFAVWTASPAHAQGEPGRRVAPPPPPPPPPSSLPPTTSPRTPPPRAMPPRTVPQPGTRPTTRSRGGASSVPPPPPPPPVPSGPGVRTPQPVPRGPARPPSPVQPRAPVQPVPPPPAADPAPGPQPTFPAPAGEDPLEGMPEDDAGMSDFGDAKLPIRQIEFEGNALFATESLKLLMELKEGEIFDAVALDRDMEMLFRYFKEVKVTKETVSGGVVLYFRVSENPLVVELNVYGADEISSNEIRGMMSTQVGYPLFPYALATDAEDIAEAYRMRGFHFAQIPEPVITPLEGGGRRVDFTVVEGPEVEVQKICFHGNTHVCRGDLLEVMRTEELGFIPFLSEATFRMDVLEEDLVALRRRVEAAGFLDAEVFLDNLGFSDNKKRVIITIGIVEHQPYTVGDIKFVIERLDPGEPGSPPPEDRAYFTEERLACLLGLKSGQQYSGICEAEGIERIMEEYYKRSYIDAKFGSIEEPGRDSPNRRGRERRNIVDLEYTIAEGPKSRLRRMDFYGNEYTRDKVLRRESKLCPGGFVDRRELDRTLTRLRGLGYFERVTMQIFNSETRDGEPLPGWKDVSYEVVEGSTGQLNFGVGISTDGGVAGSVQFTKRNFDITRWPKSFKELTSRRAFTGAGQTFDVFFAIGSITSQFAVGFKEPHFFGTDFALDTRLYKRLENWEAYQIDRFGYLVGFRYPIYRDPVDRIVSYTGLTWRHENAKVGEVGGNAVPGVYLFEGSNEQRSLEAMLSLRTLDDLLDPGWSTSTSLRWELTGTFLGGMVDYHKITFNHEENFLLFKDENNKKHRLTARVRVGFAEALEDTPEVPPFERFYAGGNTMRGFAFRGVGPHINGNPTGGEWQVVHSVEYEYPLVQDTLGLVVFLDGGTLATNLWERDAGYWRLSAGGGLRIVIPGFGTRPLALDFGFPFLYRDEDEQQLVSFSLGRDF